MPAAAYFHSTYRYILVFPFLKPFFFPVAYTYAFLFCSYILVIYIHDLQRINVMLMMRLQVMLRRPRPSLLHDVPELRPPHVLRSFYVPMWGRSRLSAQFGSSTPRGSGITSAGAEDSVPSGCGSPRLPWAESGSCHRGLYYW